MTQPSTQPDAADDYEEDDDPHGECFQPHLAPDGDYVDCDGRPL